MCVSVCLITATGIVLVTCPSQRHILWKPPYSHSGSSARTLNGQLKELNSNVSLALCHSVTCSLAPSRPGLRLISGDKSAVDPLAFPRVFPPVSPLSVSFFPLSLPLHLTCPTLSLITPSSFTQREFGRGLRVFMCVCVLPGASLLLCTAEVFGKDSTGDSVLV